MSGLAAVDTSPVFEAGWSLTLDDAVSALQWMADGSALLVGSADGRLRKIARNGVTQADWRGHFGGVTRLQLRPGAPETLASSGEDGRVLLWDSQSGEQTALLSEESNWVEQLEWTPDGKVLATAAGRTISLWRGRESLGVWYDGRRQVLAMAWAPDSRRLATASNKGLYLWRLDTAGNGCTEPMQLLTFPGAPVSVAWQKKGRALAVGTQDSFLQIWRQGGQTRGPRSQGAARQLTMRGYPGKVICLAWHPERPLIATAGGPEVVLWTLPANGKAATGQPLRHHQKTITALAWSEAGRQLAAGDRDGRLSIWALGGELLFTQSLGHEITQLAWQPGSNALIVGDTAGGLRLFEAVEKSNRQTA